jgi:hypothetical protein
MARWFLLLLALLLVGCGGFFKVPRAEYRQRVQTLGVLPLLVDGGSAITHPDREAVVDLLRRHGVYKEDRLIEILKEQKSYFDVRPLAGDPRSLFRELVAASALRGQGRALYRSYDFNAREVAELAERNVVDALLVVVLHGEALPSKRWDRLHLSYLEAPYNEIRVTAAVVTPSGEVVWEYPGESDAPFLFLQFPDFDEAYYNKTEEVNIKYISVAGLERTLSEPDRGVLGRTTFSSHYRRLFEAIASALKPGLLNPFKP